MTSLSCSHLSTNSSSVQNLCVPTFAQSYFVGKNNVWNHILHRYQRPYNCYYRQKYLPNKQSVWNEPQQHGKFLFDATAFRRIPSSTQECTFVRWKFCAALRTSLISFHSDRVKERAMAAKMESLEMHYVIRWSVRYVLADFMNARYLTPQYP